MSPVDARLARWLAPLADGKPEGADSRSDAAHEFVRGEIAKLTSMSGDVVDWRGVVAAAAQVLETKSKDLALSVYLARGLYELEGLPGLTTGIELVTGLLRAFGGALHPTRPRGRINAIQWLYDRVTDKLAHAVATSSEALALTHACAELTVCVRDVLGEGAPSATPLATSVQRVSLATTLLSQSSATDTQATRESPQALLRGAALEASAPELALPSTDLLERAQREVEVWLAPIPGESAGGVDTTYDEVSQALRTEIRKLTSLETATPDWALVAEDSQRILLQHSKDITVAAYLVAALFSLRGLEGLSVGLVFLDELLARYWDSAWPPRARVKARAAALGWLVANLSPRLHALQSDADQSQVIAASKMAVSALAERCRVCFGEQHPQLTALAEAIARLEISAMSAREASASSVPVAPVTSQLVAPVRLATAPHTAPGHAGNLSAVKVPDPTPTPSEVSEVPNFLKSTGEALVEVAKTLGELDRSLPLPYWLLRTGLWLHVERAPSDEGGRTRIPAPDRRAREGLDALLANQKWEQALAQSEALLRRTPFWLDCHRFSELSLQGMGERFQDAQRAVGAAARAFVQRMPRIIDLSFADATPLASQATVAWLRTTQAGDPSYTQAGPSDGALPDEVRTALQRGDANPLAAFASQLNRTSSRRQNFCLRLSLGRLLLELHRIDSAVTVLLGLERDLDRFELEEWEPALALQALQATRTALVAQIDPNRGEPTELRRISSRLARLAPDTLT